MAEMNIHNLAYDYSVYDEKEPDPEREKRAAAVKEPAAHKKVSIIKSLIAAALLMGILFAMIYGRVELTSLYSQQSDLETELSRLTNDNISLESELAKKTGLTKIEDYAENQLGLKKLDHSQISFVEIPREKVAEAADSGDDNLFVSIKRWFNGVLEYIGAQ